jgi:drug/metabolite transporter (DMT)-like permease
VFGSLIALNCYLWLLTRVSAQKVTTYALVNPVVALLLGSLVLGERVTPLAAMSAALVLIGVALVLFQEPQSQSVVGCASARWGRSR